MRKSILIAASNLRRARGQTAAITVLILLASVMMNLGLMLAKDYKDNFDRCHDKLHDGHVTLGISARDPGMEDFLEEFFQEDGRAVEYAMSDALVMVGYFSYNGGEINTEFVIMEKDTALNRPVGRMEIVEEGECESGIYLPMLYAADGKIAVGEDVEITIGNHTMD